VKDFISPVLWGCLFSGLCITASYADSSIDTVATLTQGELNDLSEDLAAAFSFKPLIPAEPQGLLGFDVGVAATATQLGASEVWAKVNGGDDLDYLYTTRLHAHKGLPFNLDVGASYAQVPNGNQKIWGLEARYAIWEGSALTPALAVRTAYTQMQGVDALDFATQSIDISASKGFLLFKPYGGVGYVWSQTDVLEATANQLADVDTNQFKAFAGVQLKFLLLNAVLEVDSTGGENSIGLKLGGRF